MTDEKLGLIDPPILEFKAGQRATDPIYAFAINKLKPFKIPSIMGPVKIHLLHHASTPSSGLKTLFNDLINGNERGKFPRCKFPSFKQTFGIDLSVVEVAQYKDIVNVIKTINEISNQADSSNHLLVVLSQERSSLGGFYFEAKIASIQKKIQTQIILEKTISNYVASYTDEDRGDFLWNFALGIFAKMGGIPWKLYQPLRGVSAFIALNTIVSRDIKRGVTSRQGVVALEVANNWGNPSGRFFAFDVSIGPDRERFDLDPDSLRKLISLTLDEIEKSLVDPSSSKKNDSIIIHTRDVYSSKVYETIKGVIQEKGFRKYKIIHIAEHGDLMLYDKGETINRQWPEEGSYWFLKKGHIAYLYTMGKWRYSPQRDPYVIGFGSVTPVQTRLVGSSSMTDLTETDLSNIYYLTRLHYYSGDIPRIKTPSTLRLGQRAAQLASSGLKNTDYDISYLY